MASRNGGGERGREREGERVLVGASLNTPSVFPWQDGDLHAVVVASVEAAGGVGSAERNVESLGQREKEGGRERGITTNSKRDRERERKES